MLNLPTNLFEKNQNILLCGIGGGFDCFCAVPLYHTLKAMGKNPIISSFSLNMGGRNAWKVCNNMGKYPMHTDSWQYHPEGMLWEAGYTVYEVSKCPPKMLEDHYKWIINKESIDHIVMLDGGVDSLMKGDECRKGTIAEEFVNFAALQNFPIKKTLVTMGFGCEREEEISHYRALENIAALAKNGYFLGTCALTQHDEAFQAYKKAYSILEKYPKHKKSHIHPRIIAAVEGNFGEVATDNNTIMKDIKTILISPLMSILWFFDGDGVIRSNCIMAPLRNCNTFLEVIMMLRDAPQERDNRVIPY